MSNWLQKISRNQLDYLANDLSRQSFEFARSCSQLNKTMDYKIIPLDLNFLDWIEIWYELNQGLKVDFVTTGGFTVYKEDFDLPREQKVQRGDRVITIRIVLKTSFSQIKSRWQDLIFEIKNTVRHELQHAYEFKRNPYSLMQSIDSSDVESIENYLTSSHEISAFVSGIYFTAKKQHIPFEQALDKFLSGVRRKGPEFDQLCNRVKEIWINFAKQQYPIEFK